MDVMEIDTTDPWAQLARTRLTEHGADETLVAYRARIALNMRQLDLVALRARKLHNDHTPFLSLPDELILDILLRVRDFMTRNNLDYDVRPSRPSWSVSVSLCSRLRRIILDCPSLHTRLSNLTHSTEFIELSFARSHALPLEMRVLKPSQYKGDQADRWLRLLELHGHRVQAISFGLSYDCLWVIPDWLRHMPHLRLLVLYFNRDTKFSLRSELDSGLPCVLGRPKTALLTSLSLEGVMPVLEEDRHIYQNLTSLTLCDIKLNQNPSIHISTILSTTSKLERLVIRNVVIPEDENQPSTPLQSTTLPNTLRLLEYSGSQGSHFPLLEHFIPSESVHLVISSNEPPDEEIAGSYIKTALEGWLGSGRAPMEADLRVSGHAPDASYFSARLRFWRALDYDDAHRPSDVEYTFFIAKKQSLEDIMIGPNFDDLQSLRIWVDGNWSALIQTWDNDVDSFTPRLRHFTFIIHPTLGPALSPEIYYFYAWLRNRYTQAKVLRSLEVSTEMAVVLDRLGSRPQSPSGENSPPSTPMAPLSWRDAVAKVFTLAIE